MVRTSLTVLALALAFGPRPARAWCQRTTVDPTPENPCPDTGVPLAWRQPCIEYAIDAAGGDGLTPAQLSSILRQAFRRWQDVDCGDGPVGLEVREHAENSMCQYAQFRSEGPNVNTVAFVDDWSARGYDRGALALTTTWHGMRSGEIFDVDILVNQRLGPYQVCPDAGCPAGVTDLPSVLTHEAGHFFGLGHSSVTEATMFASYLEGEVQKRTLHADDVQGFCAAYAHPHFRACNFDACQGLSLVCEAGVPPPGPIKRCWGGGGCRVAPGRVPAGTTVLTLVALAGLALALRRRGSGPSRGRRAPR